MEIGAISKMACAIAVLYLALQRIGLESVREIANYFGPHCGKSAVATKLERAKWFLLGALAEVDAA